jgi:NitT/TauT family transport system permease protein
MQRIKSERTARAPLPSLPPSQPIQRQWLLSLSFLIGWVVLALGWELGAVTGVLNRDILPPPSEVIPYLLQGPGSAGIGPQQVSYGEAIVKTLVRVTAGLGLGLLVALPLGMSIAIVPVVQQFLLPMIQTIAPIAPIAWVPVAIALMGTGDQSAIFVVFMGVFAIMTLATTAAIGSVPPELIKTARSLGARRNRLWLWVVLPAAAPSLLTIVRVNFFAAWMAVLAGEMAGINSGLGALIILGQQQFNMKLVMVGVLTIGVIGFAIDRLMLMMQQRLLWWEARGRAATGGERG